MNPQTREALGQVIFDTWKTEAKKVVAEQLSPTTWQELTPDAHEIFMSIAESVITAYWKQLAREVKEGEINP